MNEQREPTVVAPDQGTWISWLGHPVRYLALGEQTAGHYCLSIGSVSKGQGAPPHRHDFDEGFYVIRGRCRFTAGNQSIELGEGDFINIGSGTAHAVQVISNEGAELMVIAAPAGFDQFQREAGEPITDVNAIPKLTEQDVKESIHRVAKKYDIKMDPPSSEFDQEPQIKVTRHDEGEMIDAVGDRYRFLAEGEHTGGRYAIWHATVSPGGGPPPHIHRREEEAFFVLQGELEFHAEGESFIGGKGTFVNLPIGSEHRFNNSGEHHAEVLILVAPSGLEKMFRYTGTLVSDASMPITPVIPEEIERLIGVAGDYGVELKLKP